MSLLSGGCRTVQIEPQGVCSPGRTEIELHAVRARRVIEGARRELRAVVDVDAGIQPRVMRGATTVSRAPICCHCCHWCPHLGTRARSDRTSDVADRVTPAARALHT